MRRAALVVLAVVVATAAAGLALRRAREARDVHGSAAVEFTTTEAAPRTPPELPWPMFGRVPARTATWAGGRLRPPFRRLWVAGGASLIEFPPAVGYGYLFYGDGGGRVYAISARTGKRAWRYEARRGLAATPAVGPYAHGTVYESFLNRLPSHGKDPADGAVVALAAGSGRVRWRARVGASETSPLLVDGRVLVGGWDGTIAALDARSGRHLWTFHTGGAVKGGLAAAGRLVYAGSYDGHLYALDAATGRLVWRTAGQSGVLPGHGRFYATPAVAYGRVYVGGTDGRVYSFGASSGRLRWSHRTGSYVYGSAAVSQRLVLVGSYDRRFYAFDAATGAVRWRFNAGAPISGSATVFGGIVWFATLGGRSYGLDVDTGRELWTLPAGRYAPAVGDGRRLFVVGYSAIYGLRPARR